MKNENWKMKNEKISNILFSNNFKKFFHSVKNERCFFDSCEKCIHFLILEKTCFFYLVLSTFKKIFLFLKKMKVVKKALMFEKHILIFLIFWNIM